jgi:anti-anti-sigma regulatory factor
VHRKRPIPTAAVGTTTRIASPAPRIALSTALSSHLVTGEQRGATRRTGPGVGAGTGTAQRARRAPYEPEPDVRLHSPVPDVVVVRLCGPLDESACGLLALRADQQFGRATHVVIDLPDARFLAQHSLSMLRVLHQRATAAGTKIYVSTEHDEVRRSLRSSQLDQLVRICPAAETVVAAALSRTAGSDLYPPCDWPQQ